MILLDAHSSGKNKSGKVKLMNMISRKMGHTFDVVEPVIRRKAGYQGKSQESQLFVCRWIMELNESSSKKLLGNGFDHTGIFEEFRFGNESARSRWETLEDDLENINWVEDGLICGGVSVVEGIQGSDIKTENDMIEKHGDPLSEGLEGFRNWLENQFIAVCYKTVSSLICISTRWTNCSFIGSYPENILRHGFL